MSGEQKHQYHLVEPSPWPALGSAAGFTLFLGLTLYMHEYPVSYTHLTLPTILRV